MERATIKTAIDLLHGAELASAIDEYVIFNAVNVLELSGNAIDSLNHQLVAAQKDAERYIFALRYIKEQAHLGHIHDTADAAITVQEKESPLKNCATCVYGDADFNRRVPCGNCDPNTLSEWKHKEEP